MNIYYINLAIYFNFYHEFTIPKGIENLKSLIKNQDNKIILSAIWEYWPHEKILYALEVLGVTDNQDNVVLVLDAHCYRNPDHWKTVNIILYDIWLCGVHKSENPTVVNKLEHDKLLFIIGKPHKKQRIFALHELYQRDKLNKCEWSLHYKPHLEKGVRCHLPSMSDSEYERFITSTTRKLDIDSPRFTGDTTNFYHICFDPVSDLYANTSVSLVTETTFHPEFFWFITEKTWKAVNNFHPFVLLDYKKTYEFLHSLGIDTFQYAMKHPYESLVGSEEDVIKMCVDNVLHLLENKDQYKDELIASVIHNKKIFENLANTYSNNLHPYVEKVLWDGPIHRVRNDISLEVYEKLWNKSNFNGSP